MYSEKTPCIGIGQYRKKIHCVRIILTFYSYKSITRKTFIWSPSISQEGLIQTDSDSDNRLSIAWHQYHRFDRFSYHPLQFSHNWHPCFTPALEWLKALHSPQIELLESAIIAKWLVTSVIRPDLYTLGNLSRFTSLYHLFWVALFGPVRDH